MNGKEGEKTLESLVCHRSQLKVETKKTESNLVLLDKTEIERTVKDFREAFERDYGSTATFVEEGKFDFDFTVAENEELPKLKWKVTLRPYQGYYCDRHRHADKSDLQIRSRLLDGHDKLSENKIFFKVDFDILKEDGSVWKNFSDDTAWDLWDAMKERESSFDQYSISESYNHGDAQTHLRELPITSDGSLLFRFTFQHFAKRLVSRFERTVDPKLEEFWLKRLETRAQTDKAKVAGTETDIEIISSDGKTVHFHKELLIARSPVFDAMFRSEMVEFQSGVIKMKDLSEQAVNFIHHFIYDGKMLPFLEKVRNGEDTGELEQWIYVASKYQLEDVLKFFDKLMITLCAEENAMDLLKLCNRFSLMGAREEVVAFINEHPQVLYNII